VDALTRCPTTGQSVERVMQPFSARYKELEGRAVAATVDVHGHLSVPTFYVSRRPSPSRQERQAVLKWSVMEVLHVCGCQWRHDRASPSTSRSTSANTLRELVQTPDRLEK
jgi:hypothetical protein